MTIKQSRILAKKAIDLNKVFPFLNADRPTIKDLAPVIRANCTGWANDVYRVASDAAYQRNAEIFRQADELFVFSAHPEYLDFCE